MISFTHLVRTPSPIGMIELTSNGTHLTSLAIEREGALPHDGVDERTDGLLETAVTQLDQYFAGVRRDFDLPVALSGTPFQEAVWQRLRALRWGELTTYGELAAAVGRPMASRAIGGAVGANPLPVIVGCHRVLASNGRINGYSGGNGVPTKLWLLAHEGATLAA